MLSGNRKISAYMIVAELIIASSAEAQFVPSWQSCAVGFWSNARAAEDLQRGVPAEKIDNENAKTIADIANKDSWAAALISIHVVFARCPEKFGGQLNRAAEPDQEPFRRCAYASATRAAILIQIERKDSLDAIRARLPAEFHAVAELLDRESKRSFQSAATISLESGKRCVADAVQAAKAR